MSAEETEKEQRRQDSEDAWRGEGDQLRQVVQEEQRMRGVP